MEEIEGRREVRQNDYDQRKGISFKLHMQVESM